VDHIENRLGPNLPTLLSQYGYTNDELGRRTSVENSGTAFDNTAKFNLWGYNRRSEFLASRQYQGTYVPNPDPYTQIDSMDYAYDNIGNRTSFLGWEFTDYASYSINNINQVFAVDPVFDFVKYLCYDDDGNLTQIGKPTSDCAVTNAAWKFDWDAENRLVLAFTGDLDNPGGGDSWLQFKYDYMGRRVLKWLRHWDAQDSDWLTDVFEKYIYDGWNVVMVIDASNQAVRKYTWGLDLSGTIHGAGGIGGLLACQVYRTPDGGPANENNQPGWEKYWYTYDANGNVGQLLRYRTSPSETVSLAAHYEYDPFGIIVNPMTMNVDESNIAADNPFRFSTKWCDGETDLYYYGYRYYSPRLGRWISRDPIGERDLPNIYEYVHNQPSCKYDPLGLSTNQVFGSRCGDCFQTCLQNQSLIAASGGAGTVLCRKDGCRCACLLETVYPPSGDLYFAARRKCAFVHEESHVSSKNVICPCVSGKPQQSRISPASAQQEEECKAYAAQINCLCNQKAAVCGTDTRPEAYACKKYFDDYLIGEAERSAQRYGKDPYKCGASSCKSTTIAVP
jgi:RHS repeat-associated protein